MKLGTRALIPGDDFWASLDNAFNEKKKKNGTKLAKYRIKMEIVIQIKVLSILING